jgi:hypothetical protein
MMIHCTECKHVEPMPAHEPEVVAVATETRQDDAPEPGPTQEQQQRPTGAQGATGPAGPAAPPIHQSQPPDQPGPVPQSQVYPPTIHKS